MTMRGVVRSHSARSATIGSMREARRAGGEPAGKKREREDGRRGDSIGGRVARATPYKSERSKRVSASEAGTCHPGAKTAETSPAFGDRPFLGPAVARANTARAFPRAR